MISIKLNHFLEQKGITAYRLAIDTGISHAAISRYRSGKRTPRPTEMRKIAKALDVKVSQLFSE